MTLKPVLTLAVLFVGLLCPVFGQIKAGTSVQISIMGVPGEEKVKIDSMYFVSESGTVNLPFIGSIRAAGMRPESLASSIQNAYRNAQIYTNPTIQVVSTAEGTSVTEEVVYLGGQIRRTGPVSFRQNLTLYQAIQAAGGSSEFGTLKRVKLYRDGKVSIHDVTEVQSMRLRLQPNDTVEIPQKNWLGR